MTDQPFNLSDTPEFALITEQVAIADPGQFLPRAEFGTPDAESVTSWSARAVLAALRGTVPNGA